MRKSKILITFLSLLLLIYSVGCKKQVTPHPNQLSTLDGQAYDALMAAQAALDSAKDQYAKGQLPQTPLTKDIINTTGAAYNACNASWHTYHDILSSGGNVAAASQQLQADMQAMAQAIAKLIQLTGPR